MDQDNCNACGTVCGSGLRSSSSCHSSNCGNGLVESGEQGDDGNTNNTDACSNSCTFPSGTYAGNQYIFSSSAATWTAAKASCAAQGATLAAVDDAGEDAYLYAQVQALGGNAWWIGLNDRGVESTFVWSDGSKSSYRNWASGEPNSLGDEDCTLLNWSAGKWNDKLCTDQYRYICEKPM